MNPKNSKDRSAADALKRRLEKPVVALSPDEGDMAELETKNPFVLGTASINAGLMLTAKQGANVKADNENKKQFEAFDTGFSKVEKEFVVNKAAEHQAQIKEMLLDLVGLRIGFRTATADMLDGIRYFLGESLSEAEVNDFLREIDHTRVTRIMEKAIYAIETKRIAKLVGLDSNFVEWMIKSRIDGVAGGSGDSGSNLGDGGLLTMARSGARPKTKKRL